MKKYYTNSRLDIQSILINKTFNSILEIGCASGVMGEAIKNKNKDIFYFGIDYDINSLNIARSKLDQVHLFDFNKEDYNKFDEIINRKFDYIIFADVLEHLLYPINIINYFKKYLEPNGQVIISIPNIAHISVIKQLLFEIDFKYQDEGILDRTHLHFYTKKSFTRELSLLGYKNINYVYNNGYKSNFLSKIFGKWVLNYFSSQIIYVINF
jgi:2-polyprenyl-3-methyl-5-hydroxy-6-metoxy-1,4-benzoquinol methylase